MSHSPESANASKSSQEEYVRQWYALEDLIRHGESFSGKERNCAFLNTGDGRFTDVSGAASFDYPEDGRSIALTDWDQDGDLDVWVRNRNAAGLRLLRNDVQQTASTLSVRLKGTRNNPDAIGPSLVYLPSGLWLLGLGHLGQANAWALGCLPYLGDC